MLDDLGGLGELVKPGARVGVKVNMTGSSAWDGPDKPLAIEYFVTHPACGGGAVRAAPGRRGRARST